MRSYKEHFVAFLDILGFKNLITNSNCNDIYMLFNEINSKSNASLNYNGVQIQAYEHIKHKILSDSIIIFIDAEIADSFAALIDVCARLQRALINRDTPILLRGGISKGLLYYEEDIIYGEGLTNAYLLESNLANYPRIIFTGETLKAGKEVSQYIYLGLEFINCNFQLDDDYLYIINYYPLLFNSIENTKAKFDKIFELCVNILNNTLTSSIRDKYIWLYKYLEKSIQTVPQLKELYRQEREEIRNKKIDEYNSDFGKYGKKFFDVEKNK